MRWPWQQTSSAQSTQEQRMADMEGRLRLLERAHKEIAAEADTWIAKYRTLLARTCRAAERLEPREVGIPVDAVIRHLLCSAG